MTEIDTWSIKRELLGHITVSNGTRYAVYMPSVGDVAHFDYKDPTLTSKVLATAVGIPYDEFQNWSMLDAGKVIEILNKAMKTL